MVTYRPSVTAGSVQQAAFGSVLYFVEARIFRGPASLHSPRELFAELSQPSQRALHSGCIRGLLADHQDLK